MVDLTTLAYIGIGGISIPSLFAWWSGCCHTPKIKKGTMFNMKHLFYIEFQTDLSQIGISFFKWIMAIISIR